MKIDSRSNRDGSQHAAAGGQQSHYVRLQTTQTNPQRQTAIHQWLPGDGGPRRAHREGSLRGDGDAMILTVVINSQVYTQAEARQVVRSSRV